MAICDCGADFIGVAPIRHMSEANPNTVGYYAPGSSASKQQPQQPCSGHPMVLRVGLSPGLDWHSLFVFVRAACLFPMHGRYFLAAAAAHSTHGGPCRICCIRGPCLIKSRISGYFPRSEVKTAVVRSRAWSRRRGREQYSSDIALSAFPPHPPEGASAVGAARFGRGEVLEGRKVTSDFKKRRKRAERFYNVFGCFGIFCAVRGPGSSDRSSWQVQKCTFVTEAK